MRDELSDIFGTFMPELSHEDPTRRAQIQMKKALPKRFYKDATFAEAEGGYVIQLDGRTVKTPAKAELKVPNAALAALIVEEWQAQAEVIDPGTMPITRLVNTAIDAVGPQLDSVFDELHRFAGTDMLFYRADAPKELVDRQSASWDPVIDWAAKSLGARFILAEGIIHQEQPAEALKAYAVALERHRDALSLSALHVVTTLTGSALLALAYAEGRLSLDEVWTLAHLDEDWTDEHWGVDAEAQARRDKRFDELKAASAVFETLRKPA